MADLLLSALIPVVMRKAGDSVFQRIGEMWGINDQRERLHSMLLEIQAVLPDAEEKANSNVAVKSWLEKLQKAAYDADDLLDEFCYEELRRDAVRRGHKSGNVSAFFSREIPGLLLYKMSGKLKKVLGRLDYLVVQMGRFGFVHRQMVHVANSIITDSEVDESRVVGRDEDKEKVVQLLLEEHENNDLTVVPVVGMGGLGKTTLAQLVYNDPRVKEYFNLPLWVCVSKEFNVAYIVKSIIELAEGDCKLPVDNMEGLQRHLRKVLSGKRYLLVLDDVWNENDEAWVRLRTRLNYGDSGSAIIVTTRSSRVADIMGTVESYNLGWLGKKDSWSLFHKKAFSKGVIECQELVEIGRKMVQNCQGLPLAINALGSLMSSKSTVREWLAVLEESKKWEQRPLKDEVLPVLRLSYDHLPPNMKVCFAFCTVYPKDYVMDKDKLIQFWMANGFIPSDGSSSLEIKGNDIFIELTWRSFFQEVKQSRRGRQWSETTCKMHDMMHDLAQSIMGDKCQYISQVPVQHNQQLINVHHISVGTPLVDIKKSIDFFPSIRSLIYPSYSRYLKNIGFEKSNSLRILELYGHLIGKTIITPERMKHLRYLEIKIDNMISLPETLSTLYLLQTLRLECWDLEKLPEGMRYLNSLQHLYISGCYQLRSMPEGLGQLSCLQILTTYIVGIDAGNGIRELNNLNNLHGQLHLYNLRKIKHVADAREANLMAKQNLDDLALCWGMPKEYENLVRESNAPEVLHGDPVEVLDALKPCNKLKVLRIEEYGGDKLPFWLTDYQILENLIELYIIECRECMKVPPVEKLPFLQILNLKQLDNLRHLCCTASTSAEGDEGARVAFPSLKEMVLSEMPEICSWCEGEVSNKSSLFFPELTTLEVTNCPKLTAIPIVPFLQILKLKQLDNLRHLCYTASTSAEGGEGARVAFPSLKEMVLSEMPEICSWCEGEVGNKSSLCFPELTTLEVTNCPKLTAIPIVPLLTSMTVKGNKNLSCFAAGLTTLHKLSLESHDENETLSFQPWESLNELFLGNYDNIVPLGVEGEDSITPIKCRRLEISNVFPWNTSLWFWKCFTFLDNLCIEKCDNLIYLPEEVLRSLNCLRTFFVLACPNFLGSQLESPVGRSTTEVLLPILEYVYISRCPNLVEIPKLLSSVQELRIYNCPKLQWLGNLTALKILDISDCTSLNSLSQNIGDLGSLETLSIIDCDNLASLPERMEGLKSLEQLEIYRCPKIKVLPEGLLQQLKNLNQLRIVGCPHIERHFQKYGKHQHLISEIPVTVFGEERRSDILKNFALSFPPCKISCFSA